MYKMEVFSLGFDKINDQLDWLSDGMLKSILPKIANELNAKFKTNIHNEVDASRTAFKPLSEATKNKKGRGGNSSKILQDKGFLIGGMFFELGKNKIRFYNAMEYAKYHQKGSLNLPKRTIYPDGKEKYVIDAIFKVIEYEKQKMLNAKK